MPPDPPDRDEDTNKHQLLLRTSGTPHRVRDHCLKDSQYRKCSAIFGDATISPHFPNSEIEWYTDARNSIIPYRILVGMDIVSREEELALN